MKPPDFESTDLSRFGRLLCRVLLRCYPKHFRARFTDEWIRFIDRQRHEPRYRQRILGPLRFWKDLVTDVLGSSWRARVEGRRAARSRRIIGDSDAGRERGRITVESILQDLRFAFRTFRRRPMFTAVTIATLGLGIGTVTAMYSVIDGVLLSRAQYRDPDRVVSIWQRVEGREGYTAAGEVRLQYSQYRMLAGESTTLAGVALYASDWGETALTGGERPESVTVGAATASLLPVLGIAPRLGRWFTDEEEGDRAGDRSLVTVLSHDTWVRRYGRDMDVLGKQVHLEGRSYTIIGVLPAGFRMQWLSTSLVGSADPGRRDYWVPIGSPGWGESPGSTMWEAVGRLTDGVTLAQAQAESAVILAQAWERSTAAIIAPRKSEEVRGLNSPLLVLFLSTALLFLIACGNVALLSLGEVSGRWPEIATRSAIGAGRGRITRQLVLEALLLGIMGSALGVLVALIVTRVFMTLAPAIPRLDQIDLNLGVLGFAALVGIISGIVIGALPARILGWDAVAVTLKATRQSGTRNDTLLARIVLAGEIAITFVLLTSGGLLIRSLSNQMRIEPGFTAGDVVSVSLQLPWERYPWRDERVPLFIDRVLEELHAIPGVTAASAANELPFPGRTSTWAVRLDPEDGSVLMPKGYHVAPGYLRFMEIPIIEGRDIAATDRLDAPGVVVVSESLARALWGERSPIGERLIYPVGTLQVIGVARDVRQSELHEPPPHTFYVPFAQHNRSELRFAVRTGTDPDDLVTAMSEAIWRVDSDLAVSSGGRLADDIARSAREERYRTFLMSVFAILATVMAAVGIMGVTARSVAQRTRELGIRKALGARDSTLIRTILRGVVRTGVAGIICGLSGALLSGKVLATFLFGVEPVDPSTYLFTIAVVLAVCFLASYVPARRIVKVDPVQVLKSE